ncbi:hypothetical protein WJX84_000317 [Apatococcus fuscideae]|uniref:Cns1/TTC4 wheel domain-containing protein n=1 Tax=Apatococcus fuscideae TaxID=2026836 RepID=A0AAW1ST52_9CHLO
MAEKSVLSSADEELPALFWDTSPGEDNPDQAALQALDEETTSDEKAESFKVRGNDALRRGVQMKKVFFLREALKAYSNGIAAGPEDKTLLGTLYSNRAQAHLILGNNRSALEDSKFALQQDPTTLKAYFRGTRAAMRLHEYAAAVQLAQDGLRADSTTAELQQMLQTAEAELTKQRLSQQKAEAEAIKAKAPAKRLAMAICQRRWQVGPPQFHVGSRKPFLDPEGMVHWPVLFFYPENMQSDAVEDFHEAETLGDHLDVMFGAGSEPLEWDTDHLYTRPQLRLYYLSHAAPPLKPEQLAQALHAGWPENGRQEAPQRYGAKAARWMHVEQDEPLGAVLSNDDYIVPGLPVFFIVPDQSRIQKQLLENELSLF